MRLISLTLLLTIAIASVTTAQSVVQSRTANLEPGGYSISGKAILKELSNGQLQLSLDDAFDTPPGPDVRIFLSNDDRSVANAIEIADLGTGSGGINHFSGAITFDVPMGIGIDQYDYILFNCYDFNLHWAHGHFGMSEVNEEEPDPVFECSESLTATTAWVTEVNICTNDNIADVVPIKNNIDVLAGDHYAFIITDENDNILQVIQEDSYDFEGSDAGINKVYGVSFDGTLSYNMGEAYTTVTADGCATISSNEVFLTVVKEHCLANISGTITHHDGSALEGFQVHLNDSTSTTTDVNGLFEFTKLPTGLNYNLTPKDNSNVGQGISALDIIIIQKHILGIESLSSNFQFIAADATNNGSISTGDLLEIRRLILGINDDFPRNQSWRFLPATDVNTDIDLSNYVEAIALDNLMSDYTEAHFVGIKIGDVSGAAASQLLTQDDPKQTTLHLYIEDQQIKAGELITIPFSSENFIDMEGFQFTIDLDGFIFENLTSEALSNDQLHFAELDTETITTLWSNPRSVDTEELFSISLRATRDMNISDGLMINSKVTEAVAYNAKGQSLDINLSFITKELNSELFQNTPNPFSTETSIAFRLADESPVSLNIYNTAGQVLRSQKAIYSAGTHAIALDNLDNLPEGILYYRIETSEFSDVKKMIRKD